MPHLTAEPPSTERRRLEEDGAAWRRWGPYLSERAWGTVREDYSDDGGAWDYFPHDHARSRVYRWNEDGLGGICDDDQILCLALAFWNERDPILKERIFGLTGNEGNHGEDAKEYWWYVDATPTHSWMTWRYLYPIEEFPYAELVTENRRRGAHDTEFELVDTRVLDHGFWDITANYAKADPNDIVIEVTVRNASAEDATIHALPTLWFRNTWAWGNDRTRPRLEAEDGRIVAHDDRLGRMMLSGSGQPELLFCENETNSTRLWGTSGPAYPKDGINDHVVRNAETVNPERVGTKAAMRYRLTVGPEQSATFMVRLSPDGKLADDAARHVLAERRLDADEFYSTLTPADASDDEASVMRQAFAGMVWAKQFYHYDVERWLEGDRGQPVPAPSRHHGRNRDWVHVNNADVISMPDPWEYPWFAAWDLAFHCVALARLDPHFAKEQLLLLCREWYMHPNGQLPAYEWSFGDVNPPVQAWAALRVFEIVGGRDHAFLERMLHKLLLNFTWWVNRKDAHGSNVFEGGFLGLDNIGPIDRSTGVTGGGHLEQADGTAWMAMYSLDLLEMSLLLAERDRTYEDLATKFFEHFAYIASAIHSQGLWDEDAGFYFDVLHDGRERTRIQVWSMVGLIPIYAVATLGQETLDRLPDFAARTSWFLEHKPRYRDVIAHTQTVGDRELRLLSIVSPDRLSRILGPMLDEERFLSQFGLRSMSAHHRDEPYSVDLGGLTATVGYEPAESSTGLFGGNSNWRGPIWFPVNYLAIESLRRFARYCGESFRVQCPTGSDTLLGLDDVATELSRRLVSIFLQDQSGMRPVNGANGLLERQDLRSAVLFHEYFHGDSGSGLGASHQTGWTGLVAELICARRGSTSVVDGDSPPAHSADSGYGGRGREEETGS